MSHMPRVLVTGASRGIGRTIVTRLAGSGWDVVAGVRNARDAAEVVALNPTRISSVILDVTEAKQIAGLDDSLESRLDAVVNNAGIVVPGPLEAVRPEDLRRQFDVNVIGHLAVAQAVLPRLRESRGTPGRRSNLLELGQVFSWLCGPLSPVSRGRRSSTAMPATGRSRTCVRYVRDPRVGPRSAAAVWRTDVGRAEGPVATPRCSLAV
jgi:NAD(P)-dependent dehydrogenase (short-subunit alcohol dehydrogenase family)